jgi:hypothetical protein
VADRVIAAYYQKLGDPEENAQSGKSGEARKEALGLFTIR